MLAIVMEYCRLGNLHNMISQARQVGIHKAAGELPSLDRRKPTHYFWQSWQTRLQVAAGAAAGLEFMHRHGVVHRDLTSSNVVLDRIVMAEGGHSWVAKVCDFNLSRTIPQDSPDQLLPSTGTIYSEMWAAPELLQQGRRFGKPSDVFSMGIILYELLTLNLPYASRELTQREVGHLRAQLLVTVPEGHRPALPEDVDELAGPPLLPDPDAAAAMYGRLRALVLSCWEAELERRPSMAQVAEALTREMKCMAEARAAAKAARQSQGG
ncbi:kinase-like domain-containing protein [Haematococcus lacustris]